MQPHEVQHLVRNEYAQTSIRVKARQLCRRRDFGHSCRDDIEQDLWLHLLTQAVKFDGDRSSLNTFIDRMVNSAAAILVRSREREMRADGFHTQSLDAAPRGKESKKRSLRSSLSPDDGARRIGTTPRSDIEQLEDQEAMEVALAKMPPDVRHLCQRVMDDAQVRVTSPRGTNVTVRPTPTATPTDAPADTRLPAASNWLVRKYKGQPIRMLVLPDGFEFDGERYRSLSAVAKAITGSHVNGFRFFKLGGDA